MVLFADMYSVSNLLFSDREIDSEIIEGVIKCFDSGKATSETFEFEKYVDSGDVSMRERGKKLKIIMRQKTILYLKEVREKREAYC
jgi:hypothetical protein